MKPFENIQYSVSKTHASATQCRGWDRLGKLALALCVCMMASSSSRAFTLYDSKQNTSVNINGAYPPQADFDSAPALYQDFSDCINNGNDHWAWPSSGGTVTITYYFDPSFDALFPGRLGQLTENQVKAQIVLAMQQWAAIGNGSTNGGYDSIYGQYDSYSRANPLSLDIQHSQTVKQFMDVRSATVHELGHVLGFAHCDDGVKAGLNFAYFDQLPIGNRGKGPYYGSGGAGGLGQYDGIPGNGDPGNPEVFNNYFLQISEYGIVGYATPGMYGQEVMSQYSANSLPPLGDGVPVFGRQPGEIYHTLSWDELDGFLFIYGPTPVQFVAAANEASANLVIQASKNNPLTGQPFSSDTVCEGVPYGVQNDPSDPTLGVTIENATITFNSQSAVPVGFESAGFNLDITTDNTVPNVNGVAIVLSGTDNTTLVGPTFNNRVYANQPNPNYVFNTVSDSMNGPEPVDAIDVNWTNPNENIPEGTLLHVGLTPDVWDWTDYPISVLVFGDGGYSQTVPATPVHIWSSAAFHGVAANVSPLDERISASCLTSVSLTNTAGVVGLAVIAPTNSTGNPTRVYNLQLADVTGMGLTLSNLNSQTLAQLQQSNLVMTVTNFGTNILNANQQFVVILEGNASYLPPQIATNGDYIYLNSSNLVDRELFAVVTSSDGHTTVHNYSLVNVPPTVAGAFSLGTSSLLIGPAAGSNSIVLAAPSPATTWTATANVSWLHLAAANQSGSGSTNVIFTCDANSGSTRTGTLTLAGQTLTVTQAGSTYVQAPGPVTTLVASGLSQPWDAEPDGAGNVYIADLGDNAIKKWSIANNTVTTLVSSNLNFPQGVALDGAGNVYIADGHNNAVKEWVAANNTVITLFSNVVNNPYGVALDGADNVYVADFGNNAVEEWTPNNGVFTTLISSTNLSGPTSVSLDAAGNVYVSDYFDNKVKELTLANSNLATLFTPLSGGGPNGVAVDGGGNIVVADEGNYHIEEWKAASESLTTLVSSGLNTPQKIAVDGGGNIYIADRYNNAVKELPYAFVDPTPKLEGAAAGSDVLPAVLPASENLGAPFAPASSQPWLTISGALNGVISFAFTANNTGTNRVANITVLGQSVTVTQSAMPAPVITWSTPSPITYGTILSSNQLDATANVPGVFTYNPPPGTNLAAGTYTLSAIFKPASTNYLTVTNAVNLTVLQATPQVTWAALAPITYGTALSSNQLDATANVPGSFIYAPAAGAVLPTGTNTLWAIFTPADTNDYTSATANVSLDVITSSIPIMVTSLNAVAAPAGNPTGLFQAVDTTGFFGPAGANIFFSEAQVGLLHGSASAAANTGSIDPVRGTFGLNWAQGAAFVVYDATGSNQVGTAQLVMASLEAGTYNPTNGLVSSNPGQPAPATMIFENGSGAIAQANDAWIVINIPIIIPLPNPPCYECPPCPGCGGPIGPWMGDIDTNSVTATLTVGLPSLAGGGTLSANLSGNFQLVETNVAAAPITVLSSNAFPVVVSSLGAAATSPGSQPGKFLAVDAAGVFGQPGANVYVGTVLFQLFQDAASTLEDTGFIDSKDGTFAMNWGALGTFNVYDATKTNLVGSGALVLNLPETGTFDTNGMAASQGLMPASATMFLYNTVADPVVESDVELVFTSYSWSVPNLLQLVGCFQPGCDGQAIPINVNFNQGIDATNYLQAIQSTYLAGLTNLSAALEGGATFAPQNFAGASIYGNLQARSLGNATLIVQSNQLVIGALGTSGLDGANFSQGGGAPFALHWASLDPSNSLPVGANFEQDLYGTGGTVTNGLLGKVQFIKQSVSNYIGTANFSPLGVSNITVQVLYQGQLQESTNEACGWMFDCTLEPTDWEPTPRGGGLEYQTTFVNRPNTGFGPHPIYEPADAVNYVLGNLPASAVVTSVSLRASGIPQIVITNDSETVTYDGLQNTSVGNATLLLTNNQLTVGNLGATGQDGVQIALGVNNGVALNWEYPDPSNSLPIGAYLQEEFFGTGGSVTNGLLGTIQVVKNGPTNYVCSADFSPMGSTNSIVGFLYENELDVSTNEPVGPLFTSTAMPSDSEYAQNTSQFYATYWQPVPVGFYPPRYYVLADAAGMIPLTPRGLPEMTTVTSVELLASAIPQIVITNESVTVDYAGIAHSTLGNATLTVQSNQLLVANLGASGQDGVQIALPNVNAWAEQWESLDPSNSLPVGAYLQMQDFGSANQVTNGLLGTITVTKTSSTNAVLSADFTPAGVTSFTVELYNGTNEVAESTNVGTGTMCYLSKIPAVTEGPMPNDTSRFGGNYPISWLMGVQAAFSSGATQTFMATYAVIIPHNFEKKRLSSSVRMLLADVAPMNITNIVVGPCYLGASGQEYLNLTWMGNGALQSSPDLNTWSAMPPNSGTATISPYQTPIGLGNLFFRLVVPAGDEPGFNIQ